MTKTTTDPSLPQPGDTFHFLRSGTTMFGSVWRRGDEVVLTEDHISDSFDRHGTSFLTTFLDPDAQRQKWGDEVVRPGSAPEGFRVWTPGSPEEDLARDAARKAAWALDDPEERTQALRSMTQTYGSRTTSQTL